MLWWLETQETLIIVLIVFVFCYLLAALILVGLAVLSRSPIAGALHVTTPAMLTPLAVIFGLVIAFLATRVWGNLDHAQAYVVEEASGVRDVVLISSVLPSDTHDALRKEIGNYLHFVDQVDWPAMLTIGTVHAGRYTTAAVNMAIFSTAVASCVVLLMINDRPFNSGGIVIQPTALHELGSQ